MGWETRLQFTLPTIKSHTMPHAYAHNRTHISMIHATNTNQFDEVYVIMIFAERCNAQNIQTSKKLSLKHIIICQQTKYTSNGRANKNKLRKKTRMTKALQCWKYNVKNEDKRVRHFNRNHLTTCLLNHQ